MAANCPPIKIQEFDDNGDPAVGWLLYTYAADTTTPQATFTDQAGAVPHANPIVLDARGEAVVFITPGVLYDFVLKTDEDVTKRTSEDIHVALYSAGDGADESGSEYNRQFTVAAANTTVTVSASGISVNLANANTWTALQSHSAGVAVGNADQASVSTLDWYLEGTFTPVLEGTTAAGSGTYTVQEGKYTRIGNRIFFSIILSWSAHTGTGFIRLAGLPVTSGAGSVGVPLSVYSSNLVFGAGNQLAAVVTPATTRVALFALDPAGGAGSSITMDTAGTLAVSGHYHA